MQSREREASRLKIITFPETAGGGEEAETPLFAVSTGPVEAATGMALLEASPEVSVESGL